MTNEQFWQWMNAIHSQAYFLGQKHTREAMECMPGISRAQTDAVMEKAEEIRELWDGLPTIQVDQSMKKWQKENSYKK